MKPFTQESWFQTMITNYVSVCELFRGFIAITNDTGRHNHLLCFHKPGSSGSNVRLISVFITTMKSEPELYTLAKVPMKRKFLKFLIFSMKKQEKLG